jgi:cytosine/adenosine deaminase-related metal-dependent hydrolase
MMRDLVIRGATVVDGLGHDPMSADGAIQDGRIVAIGEVGKDAPGIVDAGGLALMPGIIDLHTHYDAQVTWDPTLSPSPALGDYCRDGELRLRDRAVTFTSARSDDAQSGCPSREWISMRCAPASTGDSSPLPNT